MRGNTTRYIAVLPHSLWPCKDATHVPYAHPGLRTVCPPPRARRPHSVAVSASTGSGSQNTETRPKKRNKHLYSQVCRRPRFLPLQLLQWPLIDSWELGTLAEALTEYEWPELAVFTSGSIPPPTQLNGLGTDVLSIAEKCVFFLLFSFPAAGVNVCLLLGDLMQGPCEQDTRCASTHQWRWCRRGSCQSAFLPCFTSFRCS
jgi:hypothetical protein